MRLILGVFVLYSLCPKQAFAENDTDWKLGIDSDGVKVWTRERAGSRYQEARGEIVVPASPKDAFSVIISAETCKEWVFSCVESYVVSRPVPADGIVYMRTNPLWPIADRDVVFYAKTSFDGSSGTYHAELSHRDGVLPVKEGVVRINSMSGSWTVTAVSEKSSKVVFWSHVEPGGFLPSKLVNLTLGRLHKMSLLKLRYFLGNKKDERQ
ncbi:MAG: hypothetical protein EBR09_14010 [Proteobacteria bacterium]|nr:hypothetical protein [Pseudomonadota bacterium]